MVALRPARVVLGLFVRLAGLLAGLFVVLTLLMGGASRLVLEHTDRQHIAFYAQQRPGSLSAIYLMDVPRALTQPLHITPDWVFSMAWSPAGDQLAFVMQEQNTYHLYVLDVDGGAPRLVTSQAASSQPLHWSPDGRQIIFESYIATSIALYVVDVATGETRSLTSSLNAISTDFAWSPDFERAAFATLLPDAGSLDIYTITAECVMQGVNCEPVQITRGTGDDYAPAWSADGQQLAFISNRQGPQQIYVIPTMCEPAGADCDLRPRLLAPISVNGVTISWSPDNRWLAFSMYASGSGSKLYLADMTCVDCDQRIYDLTPNQVEGMFAVWSSDSRYFIHVKQHQTIMADIVMLDIACTQTPAGCATASRFLTHNLYAWYPIWRPG